MNQEKTQPTLHEVPPDLWSALQANALSLDAWQQITPLARNEWICWVTHVKKAETRADHIRRCVEELAEGKRRPCCWPGCPHRNPNSQKWFDRPKKSA